MNWEKKLEKSCAGIAADAGVPHSRPSAPTKEDLERKFVMRIDGKGKPTIKEVWGPGLSAFMDNSLSKEKSVVEKRTLRP